MLANKKIYNRLSRKDNTKGTFLEDDYNPLDCVIMQLELKSGKRVFMAFDSYIDFTQWIIKIPMTERCYHEVIYGNKPQKLRFDVDINKKDIDNNEDIDQLSQKVLESLVDSAMIVFNNLYKRELDIVDILICESHGSSGDDYKKSYHLIIPKYYVDNNNEAKYFYEEVVNNMEKSYRKWVDPSVYSSKKNFRTLLSTKLNQNRYKILNNEWLYKGKNISYKAIESEPNISDWFDYTLITSVANSVPLPIINPYQNDNNNISKIIYNNEVPDVIVSQFNRAFDIACVNTYKSENIVPHVNYKTNKQNGFRLNLIRVKSSYCSMCDRFHDSNGAYLNVNYKGDVKFLCLAKRESNNHYKNLILKGSTHIKTKLMEYYKENYGNVFELPNLTNLADVYNNKINHNYNNKLSKEHKMILKIFDKSIWDSIKLPDIKHDLMTKEPSIPKFNLNKYESLLVKAPCGMGKTESIIPFLNQIGLDVPILTITFRRTLAGKQFDEYLKYGFIKYDDEYVKKYGLIEAHRLIVQIDSLHKVRGHYPIIILDEVVYTLIHIMDFVKEKESVWNALRYHICNSKTLFAADAFLSNDIIEMIELCGKKPYVYYNTYPKQSDKTVYVVEDKVDLILMIKESIKHGKRLIIPTNSETFASNIDKMISLEFPHIKCKLYTAKNHDGKDPTHEWDQYDVVIFSPTIIAGNSFVKNHFHRCCAYYTNKSCIAELAAQQIFRSRILMDGEIYLHVNEPEINYAPVNNIDDMTRWVISNYNDCKNNMFLGDPNISKILHIIKINYGQKDIDINHPFFKSYVNCLFRRNESKKWYLYSLMSLLKSQGINYGGNIPSSRYEKNKSNNLYSKTKDQHDEINVIIKREDCEKVSFSEDLTINEYLGLKNNINISPQEKYKIRKYEIASCYSIDSIIITPLFVDKYEDKKYIKYRLERLLPTNKMSYDETIAYIKDISICITDPDNYRIQNQLNDYQLIDIRRQTYCINFLFILGFNSPFDNKEIPYQHYNENLKKIIKYIRANDTNITFVFDCTCNIFSDTKNFIVLRWLNDRFKSYWGINIGKKYDNSKSPYIIKGLEIWDIIGEGSSSFLMPSGYKPKTKLQITDANKNYDNQTLQEMILTSCSINIKTSDNCIRTKEPNKSNNNANYESKTIKFKRSNTKHTQTNVINELPLKNTHIQDDDCKLNQEQINTNYSEKYKLDKEQNIIATDKSLNKDKIPTRLVSKGLLLKTILLAKEKMENKNSESITINDVEIKNIKDNLVKAIPYTNIPKQMIEDKKVNLPDFLKEDNTKKDKNITNDGIIIIPDELIYNCNKDHNNNISKVKLKVI